MVRWTSGSLLAALGIFAGWWVWAAEPAGPNSSTPPLSYELMINGESFFLEANRQVKLKSLAKPGVTYDVALQVAMEQHVRLSTLQFDYDWPASVQEDRRQSQRMVRIRHELGFSILISDLGRAMEPKEQDESLKLLSGSVSQSFRDSGMKNLKVSDPHERKFANSSGRGAVVHYEDSQGIAQTSLVYVLTGSDFSASCIVQYFDGDAENVLPRVKKTLDSVRSLTQTPSR